MAPPTDKYAWAHNARWVVDDLPDILDTQHKAIESLVAWQATQTKKDAVRTGVANFRKGLIFFGSASFYPVARIISRVFFHYDLP